MERLSKNILLKEVIVDSGSTLELANQKTQAKLISNTSLVPRLSTKPDIVIDVNGNEEDRQKTDTITEQVCKLELIDSMKWISYYCCIDLSTDNICVFTHFRNQCKKGWKVLLRNSTQN